jgi:hypothetical protein
MRYVMSLFLIFAGLFAFAVADQTHYGEAKRLTEIGWIAFPGGTVLLALEWFVWRKTPRPQIRQR